MKKALLVLAVLIVIVLLLPTIFSTAWGKGLVERAVSRRCDCKVTIGELSISWFSKQSAKSVIIQKDELKLAIKEIVLNKPLFPLLLKIHNPEEILFYGGFQLVDGVVGTGSVSIETTQDRRVIIKGEKFPTKVLEGFSSLPLIEILGPSFNLNSVVTFKDKLLFKTSLSAPLLSLISDGEISQGIMTLTSPLKINFLLTEALGNKIFTTSPVRPTSLEPMQLTVFPEGVEIPVSPFSISKMHIPGLILDLKKMVFKNFGTVATLISIIELRLRSDQSVPIWFQSSPMKIENGILSFMRTELLVDNKYQIGSWGSVNLNKQMLDMFFGITAQTLRKAFNITITPDDYTIAVKVDGSMKEPNVHKADAVALISALALLQSQSKLLPFMELPLSSPAPPARLPFPWR